MKKVGSKTTLTPSDADKERMSDKPLIKRQKPEAEPGPGGSQESERNEYHEEASRKAGTKTYDHKPEKNLED